LKNSWICEKEKTLIASPVLNIVERDCRNSEDDRKFKFYVMKSRDWCNIIPITEDGKVVMVKQYRIGVSDHTLEVPGGVIDPEDQSIQAAAIRELQEETGYQTLPGAKCESLGWAHPNPAILDNRCYSLIVGPVKRTNSQSLDPGEMIEVVEIPISEIPAMILNGQISHALMLNAFFFLVLQKSESSQALVSRLSDFTGLS
jgi:8-oxo-dGTP pyrophosphatase MutT (NUDIX family)